MNTLVHKCANNASPNVTYFSNMHLEKKNFFLPKIFSQQNQKHPISIKIIIEKLNTI